MKKLTIKMTVAFAFLAISVGTAKCQIYSSEDCFYASSGSSSVSYVVKFEYAKDRAWLKYVSHSTVRSNLAKSKDFYENEVWTDGQNSVTMWQYDSQKSTSSREVYQRKKTHQEYQYWGGMPCYGLPTYTVFDGYEYIAFAKDKSSFIQWFEKKDNYDGSTGSKQYYSRVPKEDLLPKSVNYDFLDD